MNERVQSRTAPERAKGRKRLRQKNGTLIHQSVVVVGTEVIYAKGTRAETFVDTLRSV